MDANLVSIVSDIVIGVSAIIVAGVALYGLHTWREELTGKARFELARKIMLLGFKIRADFQEARNPSTSSGEYAARPRQEGESPGKSDILDEWYAKYHRLVPLLEDLIKLREAGWEAKILLGRDASNSVSEAINVFMNSHAELASAIEWHFRVAIRNEVGGTSTKTDQVLHRKFERIIYSASGDDFSKQIEKVTEQLASALQIYVK